MTIRLEPSKRPNETRRYRHDWSPFLGEDTIASEDTVAVGVDIDDVTVEAGDQTVVFTVSGGEDGTCSTITHTITTEAGDIETEVFALSISADEPISLTEAKAHLRVTHDHEDTFIRSLVRASRQAVESSTGHILLQRQITYAFQAWSPYLELLHKPISDEPIEIAYVDENGDDQTLADFAQTTGRYPFRIYPDEQPAIADHGSIMVTYTAGYPVGQEPQALIQAMLLMIGHWYTNRSSISSEQANVVPGEIPLAAVWLMDQYRTQVGV